MTAYILRNVRIETGYERDDSGFVTATSTRTADLLVQDGVFIGIVGEDAPEHPAAAVVDGRDRLLLPSFLEMHTHPDKTLTGDRWSAVVPVKDRLERSRKEQDMLAGLSTTITQRANALLDIMQGYGSTFARAHVECYPGIGTSHYDEIKALLTAREAAMMHEIVAFPQRGLLASDSVPLMREMMRKGADLVGGVDPNVFDGDGEKSLQTTFDIAVEAGRGIDYHLHELDERGLHAMERIAQLTREAGLGGRVWLSHCYGLRRADEGRARDIATQFTESGVALVSHVPLNDMIPPLPLIRQCGVRVHIGSDNIFDNWYPFGNGDLVERCARACEIFLWQSEYDLSQALGLITGGVTPLDAQGARVWPQAGDAASFVLTDAQSAAHMIARRIERTVVAYNGNIIKDAK